MKTISVTKNDVYTLTGIIFFDNNQECYDFAWWNDFTNREGYSSFCISLYIHGDNCSGYIRLIRHNFED
jgi:hypothetical protein